MLERRAIAFRRKLFEDLGAVGVVLVGCVIITGSELRFAIFFGFLALSVVVCCFTVYRRQFGQPPPTQTAIIFLRSFSKDEEKSEGVLASFARSDLAKRGFGLPSYLVRLVDPNAFRPFERTIQKAMPNVPLIAVASATRRTDSKLYRVFLDEDHWKSDVHLLLEQASYVLLVPGLSSGLLWELVMLRLNFDPLRVLMVTEPPDYDHDNWAMVAAAVGATGWKFLSRNRYTAAS